MLAEEIAINNRLLSALPEQELQRLRPYLERFPLKARRVLHHWNMPIEQVYFIEAGLVSVVTRADHDRVAEVWTIGSEGVAGGVVVLGADLMPYRWIVQIEGAALCMSTVHLRRLLDDLPSLRDALFRYIQVVLYQSSQISACNGSHSLLQRLARCLLSARDRIGGDELPLTHDILSHMLGVRRASVTDTVAALEEAGTVRKGRGSIRVLDGGSLEKLACDCYRSIRFQHDRLIRAAKPGANGSAVPDPGRSSSSPVSIQVGAAPDR